MSGVFFWLSAFYLVYCARPEDWIPGLKYLPLAKITSICAILGLLFSFGKTKRSFRDLPKEATYLLLMIALLFSSAILSPVWKGGAVNHSLDFAKVYVAWVLTFLLVTDFTRLFRIVFIQTASVAAISIISVLRGRTYARLEGFLGGIYSNPNDLAFAIVLSLPFAIALMLNARGALRKMAWIAAMLFMAIALLLTASRGGFITLIVAGTVSLWHFGVRGRRFYLIVATVLVGSLLLAVNGRVLTRRFLAMSGEDQYLQAGVQREAYGSFEERKEGMILALEAMEHYPIFGVGVHNFPNYSGKWMDVHMTYLQLGAEAGIPALILYFMFFWRGFANVKKLRKMRELDPERKLFVAALHSSLVGFVVGACFAPEAYQYFPYFTVAYTSVLLAIVTEQKEAPALSVELSRKIPHLGEVYGTNRTSNEPTIIR